MPSTAAERPIRYSREQRLEGRIARIEGDIAASKESVQYSRRGIQLKRLDDCSIREMELALEATKRHPGTSFQQCLAELERGNA